MLFKAVLILTLLYADAACPFEGKQMSEPPAGTPPACHSFWAFPSVGNVTVFASKPVAAAAGAFLPPFPPSSSISPWASGAPSPSPLSASFLCASSLGHYIYIDETFLKRRTARILSLDIV